MNHLRPLFLCAVTFSLAVAGCDSHGSSGIPLQNNCDDDCKTLFSLDLGGSGWSTVRQIGGDSTGDVLLAGKISGTPNALGLEGAASDAPFLAKLDPTGHLVWVKTLPDAAAGALLAVDAEGDVFLAGATPPGQSLDLGGGPLVPASAAGGVMYVAELDPEGHHLWSRAVANLAQDPSGDGNAFVAPAALALDPTGALVIAGTFMGPLDLGGGDLGYPQNPLASCGFVVKLDSAGHHVFSQRVGSQPDGNTMVSDTGLFLGSAAIDGQGAIVITGALYGALHIGGDVITSHGAGDAFVAKIDASGGHVFAKAFGGPQGASAVALAIAPDGAILFTGATVGAVDFGEGTLEPTSSGSSPYVAALEPGGDLRFSARIPSFGAAPGYGTGIAADAEGNVVMALQLLSKEGFQTAVAVAKLEPSNGQTLHATTYALANPDELDAEIHLGALALDPLGNALLGGSFRGAVDFGQGPLSTDTDIWGQSALTVKVAP